MGGASRGLVDLVAWRGRHTPGSWKLRLELGLRNAALLERIREGTRLGRPLGSEAENSIRMNDLAARGPGAEVTVPNALK